MASLSDAEIVALSDLLPDKAEETAKRWGVPKTYAGYEQMIEQEDPDAVYIIMGAQAIHEPVMYALRQGKHVFIEKPPGVTLNQVRTFAHFAEVNGCLSMVGFQRRFVPAMTALKARVEERGPIHSVAVANLKSTANFDAPAASGILDQLTLDGMHAVDNCAGWPAERLGA